MPNTVLTDLLTVHIETYDKRMAQPSLTPGDIAFIRSRLICNILASVIKAGWLSPEQVEAKLQEERQKEAEWLKIAFNDYDKWRISSKAWVELFREHIADLERRAGVKHG